MTVGDLHKRMTLEELEDWIRFFTFRRFPDEAQDMQHALLCSLVANLMRGKDQPASQVADWLVLQIDRRPAAKPEKPPLSEADKFVNLFR